MDKPVSEALKEVLRLVVFGVVGIVITYGINYFTAVPQTQTSVIILFVLRAIDKWVHSNPDVKATGLVPF